jgi:hypothetical protein
MPQQFSHHYQDHVQTSNILQGIHSWHTWLCGILQLIQAWSQQHMDVRNKIHLSNSMVTRVPTRHPAACHFIWQSQRGQNKLTSWSGRTVSRILGPRAPNIIKICSHSGVARQATPQPSAGQTSLASPDQWWQLAWCEHLQCN